MVTTRRSIRSVVFVLLVLALALPAGGVNAQAYPFPEVDVVGPAYTVAVWTTSSIVASVLDAPDEKNPNCRGIYSRRGNLLGCICKARKALLYHPAPLASCRNY